MSPANESKLTWITLHSELGLKPEQDCKTPRLECEEREGGIPNESRERREDRQPWKLGSVKTRRGPEGHPRPADTAVVPGLWVT